MSRLIRWITAVSIVAGPLGYLFGGLLAPPMMHKGGAETIAANIAANPATNLAHIIAFVAGSFLLPVGVVGLAWLARHKAPALAALGGIAGVLGWIPLAALTALDELARTMGQLPGDYALLYDRFAYGSVMNTYLIIYIVGHLLAYVLLGIALRRARVLPVWAAWGMVASSPLTMAVFVLPGNPFAFGVAAISLLVAANVPAAIAMVRGGGLCAHARKGFHKSHETMGPETNAQEVCR